MMKNKTVIYFAFLILCLLTLRAAASAQTTEFTYQGRLLDGGFAPTANYDLQFRLFDNAAAGSQKGQTVTVAGVSVTNGIFTVHLDFGAQFSGDACYLQISVRPAGSNVYTDLNPRQPLTSAPYAVRSLEAANADVAANSNQLGGIPSSGFIHNSTTPQPGTDFNISGGGTLGGTLAADAVNSATQYSINGNPVLSVPGENTFVGLRAGVSTTTGTLNTFVGHLAGQFNTTGSGNTFVGDLAGNLNTSAGANSFFGSLAGASNTIGEFNSFFGRRAGQSNTTGIDNTFLGAYAGLANTTGTSNTFIGANTALAHTTGGGNTYVGAFVGQNTTTANYNTFVGFNTGLSTTSGGANVFLGTFAGLRNTTGHENTFLGHNAGLNNIGGANPTDGNFNTFVGTSAGSENKTGGNDTFVGYRSGNGGIATNNNSFFGTNTGAVNVGNNNSFFGSQAGSSQEAASNNSFFGSNAGAATTNASFNSFFGADAGRSNVNGQRNSIFGYQAGRDNLDGNENVFFGMSAGQTNSTGDGNSFIGEEAGFANTIGNNNTFLGQNAGGLNSTGNSNVMVGRNAGTTMTTENWNTFIGAESDGVPGIVHATALGYGATVTQSNSLVLGSIGGSNGATSVGIGTTAPKAPLHIATNGGNLLIGGGGCNPGYVALGFASTLNCTNYSLLSNGVDTVINRSTGGSIYFMQNNLPQAGISPGGDLSVNNKIVVGSLGSAGSTALCRNASNQISACSSSLRYKKDLQPFSPGLSLINQLHPITFRWKADNALDLGFGAEDIAKAEPLLVTHNDKGEVEGVKYDRISAVLVNAVKEQQAQIAEQKEEIEAQSKLLKQQQSQIDKLNELITRRLSATVHHPKKGVHK